MFFTIIKISSKIKYRAILFSVSKRCPTGFDFSVKKSCFKYVDDQMLQHSDAKLYCERRFGGRLAVLDTSHKMKETIKFLYTVAEDDIGPPSAPTAWAAGKWVKGTRKLRYDNGVENPKPHWIPPILNRRTRKMFRLPNTQMFGENSTCVAVSLWKKLDPLRNRSEQAGLYNVPCNDFYYTHPLCEVTI